MLRHDFLVDHVKRTADMNITEFTKYTEIVKTQVGPTDSQLVEEIRKRYFRFVEEKTPSKAEYEKAMEAWEFVLPKIKMNAGLATFILDYKGAESLYFFPWLMNVDKSPSTALEMAYGAGEDIFGYWNNGISNDPIVFFVENDPTFIYNRERQLHVADLVSTIWDKAHRRNSEELPTKIVDFGAGNMAWARWHGVKLNPGIIDIYAYDKDSSINPDLLFGEALTNLSIKFRHGDLMAYVNDPEAVNAELIILGGVATYIPKQIYYQAVFMPIYHLLSDGGIFFFDLQLDCPYLRRSMSIFDWPKMYLEGRENATNAIAEIEEMRKKYWAEGLKFSAEYALDTYNEFPSALMVTLQKI